MDWRQGLRLELPAERALSGRKVAEPSTCAILFCHGNAPTRSATLSISAKVGRLHKQICGRSRQALCQLWSHQLGWELRLIIDGGEVTRSQVCRSNHEILDAQDQWKAAMVSKGWR